MSAPRSTARQARRRRRASRFNLNLGGHAGRVPAERFKLPVDHLDHLDAFGRLPSGVLPSPAMKGYSMPQLVRLSDAGER
jgi:hypothetical protein